MGLPIFQKLSKTDSESENTIYASSEKISEISGLNISNFDVLKALAFEYSSVYYVNLQEDIVAVISLDDRLEKNIGDSFKEKKSLDVYARFYANKLVTPEYFQEFLDVVNIRNLRQKMAEMPIYTYQYKAFKNGKENYFQMRASRINGSLNDIVVGFADINSQVSENQEKIIEFETATQVKNEFLKNTSHELMTPLNAINGFTEIALKEPDISPKITEYLNRIHQEAQNLTIQIRNLISMSEFSFINRPPVYEPYPVNDLLSGLDDRISLSAMNKNISFTIDKSGVKISKIITDIEFINRILIHLLYNALKYTNPGGTIILSLKQEMSDEKTVCNEFHVKDDGIGMSKEFTPRIFEAFSREHTSTEGAPAGMGLGLAITERLVKALGGTITVVTRKNFGTDFKVIIPSKVE